MGKQIKGLKNHTHFRPDMVDICFWVKHIHAIHKDLSVVCCFKSVQAS